MLTYASVCLAVGKQSANDGSKALFCGVVPGRGPNDCARYEISRPPVLQNRVVAIKAKLEFCTHGFKATPAIFVRRPVGPVQVKAVQILVALWRPPALTSLEIYSQIPG